MHRDFNYIDDIIEGVTRVIDNPNGYRVYNIGNSSPVKLMNFISAIENELGKTAIKDFLPIQPGDVPQTEADVSHLEADMGYKPDTRVGEGIKRFIEWYLNYYQ